MNEIKQIKALGKTLGLCDSVAREKITDLESSVDGLKTNGGTNILLDKFCPNIYLSNEGYTPKSGVKISYERELNLFKELGIKQVSLLFNFKTYDETKNTFNLDDSDYANVIKKIHEKGMTIRTARFSFTRYGKENLLDNSKINQISSSVIKAIEKYNLKDEVEIFGILNECSVVYNNSAYTEAILKCIDDLQKYGLKIALTDGVKTLLSTPKAIIEKLDGIGVNDYPILTLDKDYSLNKLYNSFEKYGLVEYLSTFEAMGKYVFISENGCSVYDDSLSYPLENNLGEYCKMETVVAYYRAFNLYAKKYGIYNIVKVISPWYPEYWVSDEEMKKLLS